MLFASHFRHKQKGYVNNNLAFLFCQSRYALCCAMTHLTSISIIRNLKSRGVHVLMVDSCDKFVVLTEISHLSLNIFFCIQAHHWHLNLSNAF